MAILRTILRRTNFSYLVRKTVSLLNNIPDTKQFSSSGRHQLDVLQFKFISDAYHLELVQTPQLKSTG